VRVLKFMAVTALAAVIMASAAFAGDKCTGKSTAQAAGAGCCASKQASAAGCSATHTAACTGMMQNCKVEATRLSSGDLVVHYIGTTPEAVAYLQNKATSSPDKFCCPTTQKMASNEACKVDMSKVSNGVIVFVSSPKKEVVDAYEKEFAAMTASAK
jgi:hypothetical protein